MPVCEGVEVTRATRQLENGHAEVSKHAIVEAIFKPNGSRGTWEAVERVGNSWRWVKICDDKIPKSCMSEALVIVRVLRRGFGE